ncbi:MAG: hypothetical protein WCG80_10315 [Spirochaetales bacterium]
MAERISPPSWTEWTRSPNDRTPQRKVFDDILGELRKEGLIEVRGSLFVHLARYSYLHVKNAMVEVASFVASVPDSIFGTTPPAYRITEVESVLKILQAAGLVTFLESFGSSPTKVLLTERLGAGEVARSQVVYAVQSHLREAIAAMEPAAVATRASSFPTVDSVSKATGTLPEHLAPGELCVQVQDRPESNETNPNPFVQETIDKSTAPLVLLQFWPLPDPRKEAGSSAGDPEFSLLIPGDLSLENLVRKLCVPILEEFFKGAGNQDEAAGIQAKYASYMHKYREKFTASGGLPASDRIDKVLSSGDPDGEGFANAVYVVVQVVKRSNPVVYQAARIAWARCMALRVAKRKSEKESQAKTLDTGLLVTRLRDSSRPLGIEDLKRTPDSSKKKEIGSKYATLTDLLPMAPAKEGQRPLVYEIKGTFVHRENLVRAFLDLREREALAQQERLAQAWAREGIPGPEGVFLADKDVSPPFFRAFELVHQERLLAPTMADFVRDFLPSDLDTSDLVHWLWPDGRKGSAGPVEIVNRGLDVVLYEDRDRLRRRSLAGVLGLPQVYQQIVKAAWNIIFMEEGVFSFIIRKILAMFGAKQKPLKESKTTKVKSGSDGKGGADGRGQAADPRAQKAAELKKLIELVPLAKDKAAILAEREKNASQWCFKLDKEAARQTKQTVDDEVTRYANQIKIEMLTEENSAKVALFLVDKSPTLKEVTSSRAFHRYLYLTALQRRTELLAK